MKISLTPHPSTHSTRGLFVFSFALLLLIPNSPVLGQGTAFTYQGRLNAGGAPANGSYDLVFTVYDLPTGSGAFANQTNSATPVNNGLFTVTLDFGPGIFTGPERWLEIAVRTNGGGAFTNLAPRQKITATPYAITAGNVTGSVLASQLSGSIAPANIGAGTITSTMLAAGSVTTSNLADGAVNLAKLNTVSAWTPSTIFTNPTPADADTFGLVMAAVGTDKVLISTIWDSPGISGAGAAYLFSTNGSLLMTFTNPAPVQEDLFGIAMDAVGPDKVLIGAYHNDIGATNAGAAYLFNTNGTLLTTFTNPTPALGDEFGQAVTAVGANKVLIAARNDDTGATNAGAAYLFDLNGTLLVTFTNPAPATDDWFGYQVISVGADKVLISAVLDSSFGPNAGAAYLYSTNGTLLTTVTNPSPGQFVFGAGMAPVGSDKFIIAALLDATNGVAYLFNTNGTRLATFGPALGLGFSLAWVRPDKVAINVPLGPGGASFVYLFNTNGTQLATFSNPSQLNNDLFAYTLTAVGDRVVVGAPQNNTGAVESGIAYLFGANAAYVPGLISQGVLDGSITAASLGNAAIDSSKIVDGSIAGIDLADGAVTDQKINSVDGSKLTGIVQDARLSGNVAFLYANQTFTGQNTMNNPANVFAGDGNGLTNLNSSQLTSGTVADARLSANVPRLNANQTFTGLNTLNNPANSFSGNGGGLINVNALTLGGISSNGFWKTTGNGGTTPGANFLGTTDNQPLEFQVNATRALRIEPHGASAPSLVGGYFQNSVASYQGAVVAGGGTSGSPNYALGNYAFVGAGHGGQAAAYSAVVAGAYNDSPGSFSFIGSGEANTNSVIYSFIGGGKSNSIQPFAYNSILGGGENNSIQTNANYSFLGGGQYNSIQPNAGFSVLAGGGGNSIQSNAYYSVLGGGFQNSIRTSAVYSVLGGGFQNSIQWNAANSVLGGGVANSIQTNATHSVLGGGNGNSIQANAGSSVLGGGANNSIQANAYLSFLGGGANNFILPNANVSVLGGGSDNSIRPLASYSVLGGGQNNFIQTNAFYSVLGGGYQNSILPNGQYATIPGGRDNTAANYAFAAGRQAKANHQGSFVWADSTGADFASTAANQFLIRAGGGVGIGVNAPEQQLSVAAGVNIDQANVNAGTTANTLRFGSGSGEAIGSKRTAGGNQFGLDFYTASFNRMTILNDGRVGINTIAPADTLTVNGAASKPGGGSWTLFSDERLKKNIRPLSGVLDKLMALRGVHFEYKDPAKINELSGERTGMIAQEVEPVFPDWVETGLDGFKRLTFRGFEALTVEALRELRYEKDVQISALEKQTTMVKAVEGLNRKLDEREASLRKELERRGAENAELKARLADLEKLVGQLIQAKK